MKKNIAPITDPDRQRQSTKVFSKPITINELEIITQNAYSLNSLKSMLNDWNRFVDFCQTCHVSPLPASVSAVRIFLEKESRQRKFASLKRYAVTIGNIHRWHSYSEPTNHRQIKITLQNLRLDKHGDASETNPFTRKHLEQLSAILDKSQAIKDCRDMAIYGVMLECALKRSELRLIEINEVNDDGNVRVGEQQYCLSELSARWLERWLSYRGTQAGPLFCRIDRHENLYFQPIDDSTVYRIFRRASDLLELPYEMRFTGQSSRVGAVQELGEQGMKVRDIQQFGRWASPVMPAQYLHCKGTAEREKLKFVRIKPWD